MYDCKEDACLCRALGEKWGSEGCPSSIPPRIEVDVMSDTFEEVAFKEAFNEVWRKAEALDCPPLMRALDTAVMAYWKIYLRERSHDI